MVGSIPEGFAAAVIFKTSRGSSEIQKLTVLGQMNELPELIGKLVSEALSHLEKKKNKIKQSKFLKKLLSNYTSQVLFNSYIKHSAFLLIFPHRARFWFFREQSSRIPFFICWLQLKFWKITPICNFLSQGGLLTQVGKIWWHKLHTRY